MEKVRKTQNVVVVKGNSKIRNSDSARTLMGKNTEIKIYQKILLLVNFNNTLSMLQHLTED